LNPQDELQSVNSHRSFLVRAGGGTCRRCSPWGGWPKRQRWVGRYSRRHRSRSRFRHPWRAEWLPTDEKHRFREFRENHDTDYPISLILSTTYEWRLACNGNLVVETKGKQHMTHILIVESSPRGSSPARSSNGPVQSIHSIKSGLRKLIEESEHGYPRTCHSCTAIYA
jgi:hypothetical protein